MNRSRLIVAPLATAFIALLTACAPEAPTAAPAGESLALSAPSAARAAASGGGAVRMTLYGPLFTIITNDPQQQLTLTMGATLAETLAECAPGGTAPVGEAFTYRTLTTPSGKFMEHAQAENITAVVWDGYFSFDRPNSELCDFFLNTQVLAIGKVDYVITGNNYGPIAPGTPGAIESNLRAQGTVINDVTKAPMHLVVRAGYLVTGSGNDKGFNNNIQLTGFKR